VRYRGRGRPGRSRAAVAGSAAPAGVPRLRQRGHRHARRWPHRAAAGRGQARQPRRGAGPRAAARHHRHRPHPLGHARRADRAQRAPAQHGPRQRRPQRHHREPRRAARRTGGRGRRVRDGNRHRDLRAPRGLAPRAGADAAGGLFRVAQAGERGLRPGRRLRRAPARAHGGAARGAARGRLRRGRDVRRLGRARPGAADTPHRLPGGGRLGGGDGGRRALPRRATPARGTRRPRHRADRRRDGQGQLPPLHGEGAARAPGRAGRHAAAVPRPQDAGGALAAPALRAGARAAADDQRLRQRLPGRARGPLLDRGTGAAAGRCRRRQRAALPRPALFRERRRHPRQPERRNRGHHGGAAPAARGRTARAVSGERAGKLDGAGKRRRAAHRRRPRDRRRLHQGLHRATGGAGLPGDRFRPGAAGVEHAGRGAADPGAARGAGQRRRDPGTGRRNPGTGGRSRQGAGRAVPRPRAALPHRAGRRAEAEGDQLHPRRGLRRRRDEARPHRADRLQRAGGGAVPLRPAVREDDEQPPGSGGARRPHHGLHRRRGRARPAPLRRAGDRAAAGVRLRGAHPARHPRAAPGLPRGGAEGHGRGPAAQPGQERDGGV
ncbi:MAG: Glutamine--fructose-6-phosphate aminotransferase [isomerizing], partial [uncultured Acetobacteraceae bacterium]